ncbi:MAG: dihydroorotate dehydrogenase [Ruminococcaceae bacterium]|nr:dihydroorotate dehydrogenase [Oscillospiraceae bacterium]
MKKVDLSVNFAGVTLKNPIVTVSGTCGFGEEYAPYYKPSQLGAIAVKGMTLAPRLGNPPPRIAETPAGILNSIGLQNPGVQAFIDNELPRLKAEGATVIANISGSTISDYCKVAELLSETDVDFIEMNISCPNVKEGGVAFGTNAKTVNEITSEVKKHSSKPVIVKLSPNVTDITEMARAAEAGGANALSLINTLLGMRIDIKTKRPILHNNVGGLSGPAVFPVAVRMIWQVRNAVSLPLLGMGGVASAEDAIEMLIAGADAIGVGTAMFPNPALPLEIIDGIAKYMEENGIENVADISATVKPW